MIRLAETDSKRNDSQLMKIYYDNGSLKHIGYWKDRKRDGYGKGSWEDGTLWYRGNFKNGQPDGYEKMYYQSGRSENGNIKFTGTFLKTPHFFYGARRYEPGKLYY